MAKVSLVALRSLIPAVLVALAGVSPAHAQVQTASQDTIDWIALGCTPEDAFGHRFGQRVQGARVRPLGEDRQPFQRLTLAVTEKTGLLFRAETVGMFPAGPQSTDSDAVAGQYLFEAIDARIVQLGVFGYRQRAVDQNGDVEITYAQPVARPDSRATLQLTFMLGGVWASCHDDELHEQHVREVLG